ncbi:MAG: UDP-N-acetylmuramate dehydrogenase [Oscillochloris sp.]|nr:UDP-N-acetylmuramate dehydrogenase [Oscillochloris sp.]
MTPIDPHTAPVPLQLDEPLARHTSWRIGGPARYYAEPRTPEQAAELSAWAVTHELPLIWIGGGTNLLASDDGFPGLVARYRAAEWQIVDHGATATLHVQAGAPMAGTARRVVAMGWAGLEWAEGVPGTIGGAVFGNAGCYGGDIAGVLHHVDLLLGAKREHWSFERMQYGYRTSALKQANASPPPLILAAELRLARGDAAALTARVKQIAVERKGKTPWGSSCGSVFKNPPGDSSGRLIEAAGLKGRRVGAAEISGRHANYIVNLGGATSADILALIDLARNEVKRRFGVELELEVRKI